MTPIRSKTEQIAVRLPPELIERLDALTEPLSPPGVQFGRSDVMRMALTEGVAILEKRAAEAKRRK